MIASAPERTCVQQKFDQVIYNEIYYGDLEDLITNVYELQIAVDLWNMESWVNSMDAVNYDIKPKRFTDIIQNKIDDFMATGYGDHILEQILVDMCNKKIIDEGKYLIILY